MTWRLAVAALAFVATAAGAQQAEVVDLPTRPGVTERMLVLLTPQATSTVILMTGGNGRLGIFDNGSIRADGNFLVRSRGLFAQRGHAVVVLDTPSDHSRAPFLGGTFRDSAEHAADVGAAVAWAREKFGKPVWVIGTSRGTHSAANAALNLQPPRRPDGIVLTSSILGRAPDFATSATARPLRELPLKTLALPVLVVHHEQDSCLVSAAKDLPALAAQLPPGAKVLTYSGGRSSGPPCEAFAYHGYNGIEDQVVGDISAWIGGAR